jgi:SAM-dependent methyltransferase
MFRVAIWQSIEWCGVRDNRELSEHSSVRERWMNGDGNSSWIWSRYWQRGQNDECLLQAFSLAATWRNFLSGFADGARLLDLATGAGDAAAFAANAAHRLGRRFEIDAVDAASLPQPLADSMRADGVRLMGDIDVAALPFEDRSYDGVFSQFGIEYGRRPNAFREAARVLRANGRGLFIMHHQQSVITRSCAVRLARHREVVGAMQCFAAAKQFFTSRLLGGSPASLQQAEARFRNEVTVLRRRLGSPPSDPNLVPTVSFLSEIAVMPARYDPADALRRVEFAQEEIASWRLRQEAQQAAALDSAALDSICEWLAQSGLETEPPEILHDGEGEIAAWVLRVHRPATPEPPQ